MVSLDGDWDFRLVDTPDAVTRTMVEEPTTGWDTMPVPASWVFPPDVDERRFGSPIYLNIEMPFALDAPDVPDDNPTGVYRRAFRFPRRGATAHVPAHRVGRLAGHGVGQRRIRRAWARTAACPRPSTSPTTSGAATNDLAIVVPQWSDASWIEDQDQWWLPGLHRSVELVSVPTTSIADAGLVPGLARTAPPALDDRRLRRRRARGTTTT